jgi:hypothetical protein
VCASIAGYIITDNFWHNDTANLNPNYSRISKWMFIPSVSHVQMESAKHMQIKCKTYAGLATAISPLHLTEDTRVTLRAEMPICTRIASGPRSIWAEPTVVTVARIAIQIIHARAVATWRGDTLISVGLADGARISSNALARVAISQIHASSTVETRRR